MLLAGTTLAVSVATNAHVVSERPVVAFTSKRGMREGALAI